MGAPDPQVDARAVKLDRVATTLIGAVAAVGGLLAVYGVSSDRINLLLDDDQAKSFLVAAGVCAVLAVCASLFALMARRSEWEVGWLVLGSAGYVAGLLCSLFAAAGAANSPGRPAVTAVEIRPGPPSLLTVSVRSSRLDEHDRLAVQLVHSSSREPFYAATLQPDGDGRLEQQLTVPLPGEGGEVSLVAWRVDSSAQPPDCASGRAEVVCVLVMVP